MQANRPMGIKDKSMTRLPSHRIPHFYPSAEMKLDDMASEEVHTVGGCTYRGPVNLFSWEEPRPALNVGGPSITLSFG